MSTYKYRIVISIILFSLVLCSKSWASTYYVAKTGSNSNIGSASQPWFTIQFAANNVIAGDTVFTQAGTYNESVTITSSGSANNLITFKTEGEVITRGFTINGSYIVIDGFKVTNYTSNYGISFGNNSSNGILRNNYIYGTSQLGIGIWGSQHFIHNNEISDLQCDAFRVFGNGHVIADNYIHDLTEIVGGCHVDVFQSFSDNNADCYDIVFERNYVENHEGQIFMMDNVNNRRFENITVRNNVYNNVRSAGNTYVPVKVYNNTFYKSGWGNNRVIMLRNDATRGNSSGSEIKNNIFLDTGTSSTTGWYTADTGVTYSADYNLIHPTKSGFSEINGFNGIDPLLVNVAADNFRLKSNSPAINSGIQISTFSNDKDNILRPKGIGWDIGAYEFWDTLRPSPPVLR